MKRPKTGSRWAGYRLIYTDEQSAFIRSDDKRRKQINLSYSIGLIMGSKGVIKSVIWDSPAFQGRTKIRADDLGRQWKGLWSGHSETGD